MSAQPVHIRVDAAEQSSGVPGLLGKVDGVMVAMARLEVGDYLCAEQVIVERKTAVDFIASIMDRRLFEQVAKMVAGYETAVLVLEGDVYGTRSAIAPSALDGALSWLATLSGVTVLPSGGVEHSARLIATIARHAQHGLGYEIPLRHAKPKHLSVQQQYLVEGLPGVGPGRARALLEHFGSPEAVFSASVDELRAVRGIGEKAAESIHHVVRSACKT
jgi:Fanconi anemia group M protein